MGSYLLHIRMRGETAITHKTIYHRGDIYLAQLPHGYGSVQCGIRPVLIIQNDTANSASPTVIVAPLTSKLKKPFLPTHLILKNIPGLKYPSMVLFEQIMTLDKQQIFHYMGRLLDEQYPQMEWAIQCSVGSSSP